MVAAAMEVNERGHAVILLLEAEDAGATTTPDLRTGTVRGGGGRDGPARRSRRRGAGELVLECLKTMTRRQRSGRWRWKKAAAADWAQEMARRATRRPTGLRPGSLLRRGRSAGARGGSGDELEELLPLSARATGTAGAGGGRRRRGRARGRKKGEVEAHRRGRGRSRRGGEGIGRRELDGERGKGGREDGVSPERRREGTRGSDREEGVGLGLGLDGLGLGAEGPWRQAAGLLLSLLQERKKNRDEKEKKKRLEVELEQEGIFPDS